MGSRSWSKGRLYRISIRLDIRFSFPYAQTMECPHPRGQMASFRIRPFRLSLVSAFLMVVLCATPLLAQAGGGTQACGGNSTVDILGAKTAASARAFLAQLQTAIQANNKEQIADMVSYPVLVLRSGKRTRIRQKKELLTNFGLIFTDPVRDAILHQTALCLFGNSTGAMVGNGEVWFQEQASNQWKIITINESATAP
jgi:hypothetical protein